MHEYEAFIFDFDMTLADSAKVIASLLNECANDFGYPSKSFEYLLPVIGNTHEVMLQHVTGVDDPKKLLEMRTHYRQLCRTKMAAKTKLFPDVPDMLRGLEAEGYKIGLLSLKLRDVLMQTLDQYQLSDCFGSVVGCEESPSPKPDPSGLFITMKDLGVTANQTLYVGDSLVDEGAAKAAKVDFLAMLRGGTKKEQFDEGFVKHFYSSAAELLHDVEEGKW